MQLACSFAPLLKDASFLKVLINDTRLLRCDHDVLWCPRVARGSAETLNVRVPTAYSTRTPHMCIWDLTNSCFNNLGCCWNDSGQVRVSLHETMHGVFLYKLFYKQLLVLLCNCAKEPGGDPAQFLCVIANPCNCDPRNPPPGSRWWFFSSGPRSL